MANPKDPKKIPVTYAPGAEPKVPPVPGSARALAETADQNVNPPELERINLLKNPVTGEVHEKGVPAPRSKEEDFDDKVAAAVAKALVQHEAGAALKQAEMFKAMGKEMAQAFAQAQMAVEAVKTQTAHDKILAEARKKAAKEEKCNVCRQAIGDGRTHGCGGPWRRDIKTGEFVMQELKNPDGSNVIDPVTEKPVMVRIDDPAQFHVKMVVFPVDPLAAEWFPYLKINGVEYFSQGPNHEIWVPRKNDFASTLAIYEQNEREQRVGRKHVRKFGGTVSGTGNTNMAPTGVGFNH